MLEELRIRGLGVIDDATLPLGPGLTVVTGETGAGKTMVVSGLLLLFGGRGDAARVRTGAEQACVDGRLELAARSAAATRVRDAGGEVDAPDGGSGPVGLTLRRTVSAAGRSRAHVGGAPAPVAVLGELAEHLLAVHGQSDQLRLARPAQQRAMLDRFAGTDLGAYAAAYAAWRAAAAELDERRARLGELRREADLLQHGLAEIAAAEPLPGEDVDLTAAASRLAHADALRIAAHEAHDALLGSADDPLGDAADVTSLLGGARRSLDQQAGADPELDRLAARLTEIAALVADLGSDLGAYEAGLDADPQRLEQLEARRAVLAGLVRKYADGPAPDLDGVATWATAAAERLKDLDVSDEALAALAAHRDQSRSEVIRLAEKLSQLRRDAAARLGSAVTAELHGLAMPGATCTVEVRSREPGPDGADEVEVLLQPHADVPALPLARGASGGELSRVMLAIEVSLAGTDPVPTMVFDEVDAGVGGRAVLEVGRRLARLAGSGSAARQVVVVTHLAQVAAFADTHIVVDKRTGRAGAGPDAGVTASDVRVVVGEERQAELARMLAGTDSPTALEHAAELLADAARSAAGPPPRGAAEQTTRKAAKTRR
jgi:DNA repair protein RecN (Recombination protein N)